MAFSPTLAEHRPGPEISGGDVTLSVISFLSIRNLQRAILGLNQSEESFCAQIQLADLLMFDLGVKKSYKVKMEDTLT